MKKAITAGLSPEHISYISELESEAKAKADAAAELELKVETLEQQIARLKVLLEQANKRLYGQKSEKSRYVLENGYEQLSLFNEAENEAQSHAEEPTVETVVAAHTRKPKRTREEIAASVPVVEVICELEPDKKKCNICESSLRVIGREHVRDELEIIPAQVHVLRYVRINYACTECEKETDEANIIKAPAPAPVMKRSLASPSSVAYVMYQKYVNAMPLYRQEKDWANQGVILPRATLANWIIRSSHDWLEPIYKEMYQRLLKAAVINADETVVQVLKEEGKKASSESRMWVYTTGIEEVPIILFEYQASRSGQHARRFLEGYKGYLQTDGYSGYNAVPNVIYCGCWAHLRRKLDEAMPKENKNESKAAEGFAYCNKLFKLEDEWKTLTAEERYKMRLEKSKPILDAFWDWVSKTNALAGSKLGTAITYAQNQKEKLSNFLLDGRIELSNNRVENALRPFCLGRKNWLFSDTTRGAQASATVYSIIESAKANNLNPFAYLMYLFTRLPSLGELTSEALDGFMPWSPCLPESCRNQKPPG